MVYFVYKKIAATAIARPKSKSSTTTKPPSDIDFITSIIEARERRAREEADQLEKLRSVGDDEFEDLPDSDNDRRARHVGSGRKYSHWANQARMRRKQAAAKRRLEALNKAREERLDSGMRASKKLEQES